MPEHLIAVANRFGLLIQLHPSKKMGIAEPENLDDLERLKRNIRACAGCFSHCARSYSSWGIERAAPQVTSHPEPLVRGFLGVRKRRL